MTAASNPSRFSAGSNRMIAASPALLMDDTSLPILPRRFLFDRATFDPPIDEPEKEVPEVESRDSVADVDAPAFVDDEDSRLNGLAEGNGRSCAMEGDRV